MIAIMIVLPLAYVEVPSFHDMSLIYNLRMIFQDFEIVFEELKTVHFYFVIHFEDSKNINIKNIKSKIENK